MEFLITIIICPISFPLASFTQPLGPIQILHQTITQKGISGIYAGCTALVVGNAVKAGVRFLSYDQYKSMLKDKEVSGGGISGWRCGALVGVGVWDGVWG